MIDFAKHVLIIAKEIKKDVNQINPNFNRDQLEAEVLETKLKGLFTQLKTEYENRNYLLEEEAKYGTSGIPVHLRNNIKDLDNKINTLEEEILELKEELKDLGRAR